MSSHEIVYKARGAVQGKPSTTLNKKIEHFGRVLLVPLEENSGVLVYKMYKKDCGAYLGKARYHNNANKWCYDNYPSVVNQPTDSKYLVRADSKLF
jgi:hypothetical protein